MGPTGFERVCMELRKIGFSKSTYSEIIFSVRLKERVNAAPMGVLLHDEEKVCLKIYKGGKTYDMILNGAEDCVLNITRDPVLFYKAVFEKDKIAYHPAKHVSSPRISGCNAYVECSITNVTLHEKYIEAVLKPLLIDVADASVKTYNRAGPAIIEALICYTKLPYVKDTQEEKVEALTKKMLIFRDIVYHSTKNSMLRRIASKMLEEPSAASKQKPVKHPT